MNNKELAKRIIELTGGTENIVSVRHCGNKTTYCCGREREDQRERY